MPYIGSSSRVPIYEVRALATPICVDGATEAEDGLTVAPPIGVLGIPDRAVTLDSAHISAPTSRPVTQAIARPLGVALRPLPTRRSVAPGLAPERAIGPLGIC